MGTDQQPDPEDKNWQTSIAVRRGTIMLLEADKRKNETMEDIILRWHKERQMKPCASTK